VRFRLCAGAAIVEYLGENENWRGRLTQCYGLRFDIVTEDKSGDRNFDVTEQ